MFKAIHVLLLATAVATASATSRQKRSLLVLPSGAGVSVILDLSIPIGALSNTSTALDMTLPFSFSLPSKSDVENLLSGGRDSATLKDMEMQRSNEQKITLYKIFEDLLNRFGLDGKSCIQRALCEISQAPVFHDGLYGQVFNFILTPELYTSNSLFAEASREAGDSSDYFGAYRSGLGGESCGTLFESCPFSLLTYV